MRRRVHPSAHRDQRRPFPSKCQKHDRNGPPQPCLSTSPCSRLSRSRSRSQRLHPWSMYQVCRAIHFFVSNIVIAEDFYDSGVVTTRAGFAVHNQVKPASPPPVVPVKKTSYESHSLLIDDPKPEPPEEAVVQLYAHRPAPPPPAPVVAPPPPLMIETEGVGLVSVVHTTSPSPQTTFMTVERRCVRASACTAR